MASLMMKFQNINSPIALAAFGAFFVPEPLGVCLVLASAIWWLTGVTAMAQGMSNASSERDRQVLTPLHYAAVFITGTVFLVGLWTAVGSPSHRLQTQASYGGNQTNSTLSNGPGERVESPAANSH
jgi:hypothetical protein